MKKKILLFSISAVIGALIFQSYAAGPARSGYDCTGAEAGGTGTFANPTGCSAGGGCHSTSATTGISAALELDSAGVAVTSYKGGMTYTVKLTGTNTTSTTFPKYGFQIAAMKGSAIASTVSDAGTWATTGLPASTHIAAPSSSGTLLTVAEQSSAIALSGGSFTKSFSWTAPAAGTGTISIWSAVNFVNGNTGADNSDKWNTNHIVLNEETASSTGVQQVANTLTIKAFPNPVSNMLNLQTDEAGTYSAQVYDLNGRSITAASFSGNGSINAANWAPGMYQVVITKEGQSQVIPVVKK